MSKFTKARKRETLKCSVLFFSGIVGVLMCNIVIELSLKQRFKSVVLNQRCKLMILVIMVL